MRHHLWIRISIVVYTHTLRENPTEKEVQNTYVLTGPYSRPQVCACGEELFDPGSCHMVMTGERTE